MLLDKVDNGAIIQHADMYCINVDALRLHSYKLLNLNLHSYKLTNSQ